MFPQGENTEIGVRGIALSEDQKRRINLARALYADKDIYFLDEPLNYIEEPMSSQIFQMYIQVALKHKTVVFSSNIMKVMKSTI